MKEVYNFIEEKIGLSTNDTIVVGVSGGPDSMALLHVLLNIRNKMNLTIVCAHINHNKRKESDQEQIDLEKYCISNKIIFECIKVKQWSDDNFESEARSVRYGFYEEIIENYGAKYLMTAHHGDDLIETIMMRLVRGSTLKGYSGFEKIIDKNNYKIVRPFISLTKIEIEEYCKQNNIKYAIDESNNDLKYTRNRYRKEMLPFLKKENANVHKKFLKFSEVLLESNNFIEKEVEKIYSKVFQNGKIYIEKFLEVEHIIQVKIIYSILEKIYGDDLIVVNDIHVDLILELIKSKKSNNIIHLPNNVIAIKEYNEVFFKYDEDSNDEYEIQLDEMVNLPNGKIIEKVYNIDEKSNNIIRLSSSEIKLPLYVRNKRDGDKIEVKGLNGSKKVSDIYIDNKIKPSDRKVWPVVLDSTDKIVWIPGLKKSKLDKKIGEEYDIILKYY